VLDPARILANEIAPERAEHLVDGGWVAPTCGLTETGQAVLSSYPDEMGVTEKNRLDFFDLQLNSVSPG